MFSWHPASHEHRQLSHTLPFIFCSLAAECSPVVTTNYDPKRDCIIRGIDTKQGFIRGNSFMSFCEALAADTLKQSLREGLGSVLGSTHKTVKIPQPPGQHSFLTAFSVDSVELECMNVRKYSVKDAQQVLTSNNIDRDLHLEPSEGSSSGKTSQIKSDCKLDFLALDVQALEKMTMSYSSEAYLCNEDKSLVAIEVASPKPVCDMVRSATDFDIKCKRNGSRHPRLGYDPRSIYDITEFPQDVSSEPLVSTMRSISASGHLSSAISPSTAPQPPLEMASYLEEPLLLVGHKLEWEGHVNARKISAAKRRKKNQQMTLREQKKLTRVVIGYTLAFFLLVIVTFHIVYFS